MALVEQRVCDVYGTTKDVKHYRVQLEEVSPDKTLTTAEEVECMDLSPRAVTRLENWISRGTRPPKAKAESDNAAKKTSDSP